MIKIYGYPRTRTIRVLWALEEIGAEYELAKVDLMKGGGHDPEYTRLNPAGKVPLLVDGELVLSESGAICTYLGDRFPESGLVPGVGTNERALYDKCCFFALCELEQPLWTMAKHWRFLPKDRRVPEVIETARWEFARCADVLSTELGDRAFAVGTGFTAADILLAHVLNWARGDDMALGHEALEAYTDRMVSRPALARAREREQEDLAG